MPKIGLNQTDPKFSRFGRASPIRASEGRRANRDKQVGLSLFDYYQKIIDDELKSIFKHNLPKKQLPKVLYDAMYYSVFSGGKRIRPILCCLTYLTLAENQKSKTKNQKLKTKILETILPFACGVELLHTFSLIQDDLPSMDNDDFRRGKPSLHKVFGEAIAILASDALFALAFELFAKALVADKTKVSAITELSRVCGVQGLVAGQVEDILTQTQEKSLKEQEKINRLKTAELFAGAMKIGAIVAQASVKDIDIVEHTGRQLGLLFQTVDDLQDEVPSSKCKSYKLIAEKYATAVKKHVCQLIANTQIAPDRFHWLFDFTDWLLSSVNQKIKTKS
ncbi:MAG: polyprenyl synthetase family protein [candidate division WOR-3 bacterium]|nr:polyprenyl synthetase family protein [candidate division WOR-3 bacterium]